MSNCEGYIPHLWFVGRKISKTLFGLFREWFYREQSVNAFRFYVGSIAAQVEQYAYKGLGEFDEPPFGIVVGIVLIFLCKFAFLYFVESFKNCFPQCWFLQMHDNWDQSFVRVQQYSQLMMTGVMVVFQVAEESMNLVGRIQMTSFELDVNTIFRKSVEQFGREVAGKGNTSLPIWEDSFRVVRPCHRQSSRSLDSPC